jgi:hypothetical protein
VGLWISTSIISIEFFEEKCAFSFPFLLSASCKTELILHVKSQASKQTTQPLHLLGVSVRIDKLHCPLTSVGHNLTHCRLRYMRTLGLDLKELSTFVLISDFLQEFLVDHNNWYNIF